jgi:ubiquinone/menaquinone biosynthesis C-methylase UbiE
MSQTVGRVEQSWDIPVFNFYFPIPLICAIIGTCESECWIYGDLLRGMTTNRQINHFAEIAGKYVEARRHTPCSVAFMNYWNKKMLAPIPGSKLGGSVLDNMCGAGELLEAIETRFDVRHGADLSFQMLSMVPKEVKERCQGLINCDARALPLGDGAFDVVFCRGGLHHIPKRFHQDVVIEVYRVLRSDGYFVFSEPVDDSFLVRMARRALYAVSTMFDKEEEGGLRTPVICQILREVGFEVKSIQRFGYIAYALISQTDVLSWFRSLRNQRLFNLLIEIDERLPMVPLWRRLNLAVIISARKIQ